jgi:hypothetical protein
MADIVGAARSKQGSAWLDVTLDDGTVVPIEDPSGEEERRINQIIRPPKATAGMAGPMAQAAQAAGVEVKPKALNPLAGNPLAMPAPMGPPLPPAGAAPPIQVAPRGAFDPAARADLDRQQRSVDLETAAIGRRNQAAPDSSAPSPMDQAAGASGIALIRRPGTRGGFQPSTRSASVQGPMEEDREAYLTGIDRASMLRQEAGEEELVARGESAMRERDRGFVAAREAREKIADIGAKVTETERIRRITSEKMNVTSKVPENPMGLFERSSGWFTVFAAIAATAGGLKSGASGGPNEGVENILKLLDMDVQSQRANKSALLADYERQLGDSDAALSLLRADMAEAVAKETEGMKRTDMAADQIAGLSAISKALLADAADKRAAAEAATMRTVATQEQDRYVAPTPGGVEVVNVTQEQLKQLGITPEQHQKALAAKIGGAEGAATVGQAITAVQAINQDLSALEALAPDGVLPNKIVWNELSQSGRRAMTYLFGADIASRGAVSAEEVSQILTRRTVQEAKKMGGVITENDLKFTERIAGESLQAKRRWMQGMKQTLNNEMRTTVVGHMPGVEQPWLDIVLQRQGATTGVPGAPSLRPR